MSVPAQHVTFENREELMALLKAVIDDLGDMRSCLERGDRVPLALADACERRARKISADLYEPLRFAAFEAEKWSRLQREADGAT